MTHPTSIDQALALAVDLRAASRLDEAAAVLSEALRGDSTAPGLSYQLALIETERGNWSEAERLARVAGRSGEAAYATGLGEILIRVGKHEEAENWLLRLVASDSNDAPAQACLGFAYYKRRKLDEALNCLDKALAISPDFASAQRLHKEIQAERDLYASVKELLRERKGGVKLSNETESAEVEFPSASLDANGQPRFMMRLPASLIVNDIGAAYLFYHEVAGRGLEFPLRRFLDLHVMSDDVFIDVGAHWGIHSLTAATLLRKQVSALAIEAHPENSQRLRRWIEQNRLEDDVEVISKAISDRTGVGNMWLSSSSMGHSLRTAGHENGSSALDVEIATLDHLIAERPHLRWRRVILKIDVEGCELEVLAGAKELFSTAEVAAVIWEKGAFYEGKALEARNEAIFRFLDTRGFEHFRMEHENSGGCLIALEGKDALCNVFSLGPSFERKQRYE